MAQYIFFNGKEWVMYPYYFQSPDERLYWEKHGELPPDKKKTKKPSTRRKEQESD